eukprot:2727783-Pleurochrysis_carterae.AAC.3
MLATASIGQDPGVETWKGEEGSDGWNQEKVEKDVLEVAQEDGCSAKQVYERDVLSSVCALPAHHCSAMHL